MTTESKDSVNPFDSLNEREHDFKKGLLEYMAAKRKIYDLRQKQRLEIGVTKLIKDGGDEILPQEPELKGDEEKLKHDESDEEKSKKRKTGDDTEVENDKKRQKREDDEERINRTKRMGGPQKLFSNLLFGTLKTFKAESSRESNVKKEEIRRELEKKVEEKTALDSERLKAERLEVIEKDLNEVTQQTEELEKMLTEKQNEIWAKRVEAYENVLNNFIKTTTYPPIYYMPKKRDAFVEGLLKRSLENRKREVRTPQVQPEPVEEESSVED